MSAQMSHAVNQDAMWRWPLKGGLGGWTGHKGPADGACSAMLDAGTTAMLLPCSGALLADAIVPLQPCSVDDEET